MKRLLFLPLIVCSSLALFAQKPSAIGFSANLVDFSASLLKVGKVDPGVSLMYWKGISPRTDFSVRYNALFSEYPYNEDHSNSLVNELEGSLHGRLLRDERVLSPFLTAGIGIGQYGKSFAPYAPLGGGLQLNMLGEGYIFLQANYRVSFIPSNLDNNMFYSLGFTERIGRKKETPVKTVPIPALEVSDRDNDGVVDSLDACPDAAGSAQLNGCPDGDGDGIADKDDKCPTEKGVDRYNGCPVPDSDGDGVNDEEDKCPNEKGVARYNGCPIPDRDGDGVNDEEDKCPDLAGVAVNKGCPEIKEEVKKKFDYAAQHLYFATGSYKLLQKSNKGLDEVAALMKDDPALKLSVNGYTDNTGSVEKNKILSENRAGAVRDYLVAKGIDESRIIVTGYGIENPIADNNTAAGRAKNRRVEFTLDY